MFATINTENSLSLDTHFKFLICFPFKGVYYKEPKVVNDLNDHIRSRRDVPCEVSTKDRSKRSLCVIIPSPPPTPTTQPPYGSAEHQRVLPANADFDGNVYNPNETQHYDIRIYQANCLFWNDTEETWTNNGCQVRRICL